MTDDLSLSQQCHLCREPLPGTTEDELGRNAIEHWRLFHPTFHDVLTQQVDRYLELQFQALRPEDFR